jgi:NodT family efflux transporter outer membrane factor (OMF) lipoprotein
MNSQTVRFLLTGPALAALFLTSCKTLVGPDYVDPGGDLPDAWSRSVLEDLQDGSSSLAGWWKGFHDPALNTLIERTREANPTLKAALAGIAEARAQRGIARSQGLPQAGAEADYSRTRRSETLLGPVFQNPSSLYSTGFDAGWEIDLFGGIRRSVEAAEANVQAREETYRDALVTLFAEVALNYVDYRTLEERIAVANRNIAAQRESVELTKGRLQAGLVPRIDVTQAETNLALSESAVPLLRAQLAAAKNRLAALTGGFPDSVSTVLASGRGIPVPSAGYSAGLPADLLRARPDIRQAERDLAAQVARIGVAEADLYPRLTLFGDFRLQTATSGDLFDSASRAYSFGPSFRWAIFSAGRIRNEISAQESRALAALATYETTVLAAVEEVETSMAAIVNERDRLGDLGRAVDASRETVSLIKDNYENGLVSFQNVLDAERTKFDTEDEQTFSRGQLAGFYISLYKALGGGTECEYIPATGGEVRPYFPWKPVKEKTAAADGADGTAAADGPAKPEAAAAEVE